MDTHETARVETMETETNDLREKAPIAIQPLKVERMDIARIDVTDQTEHGLKLFEERVRVAKEQMKLALKLTQPGQWVVMSGGPDRESVYATAGASDRILRFGFGMSWGEGRVRVERDGKGNPVAICSAPLLRHDGTIYEVFEGRRTMGGYVKNENDMIKAAQANMKHRAVTAILGLSFLTPADLAELGLDLSKLPRRVEFASHDDADAPTDGEALVPWGKKKGEAIGSLDARDLDYYEGKAREAIADPEKAKWRVKEQRWLDAVLGEKAKRRGAENGKSTRMPAEQAPLSEIHDMIRALAKIKGLKSEEVEKRIAQLTTVSAAEAAYQKLSDAKVPADIAY